MEVFWGDVHQLFGNLMVKSTKSGDSINKIWLQKSIMNRFKQFISPSATLWNSCYHLMKEQNHSGVPES